MAELNTTITLHAQGKRLVFALFEEVQTAGQVTRQPRPIDDATTLELEVRDPDGAVTTLTASFQTDGTDGVLVAVANPIGGGGTLWNALGDWAVRAHVVGPSYDDRSLWRPVTVDVE